MTILQEALLWKTALGYLGPSNLYQVVVDLWRQAGAPARPTVEYLTSDMVGDEVVIILRNAQARRSHSAWQRGATGGMCFVQPSRERACRWPTRTIARAGAAAKLEGPPA
jgi:hypothetical protein